MKIFKISLQLCFTLCIAFAFSNCGDDEAVATFSYTVDGEKIKPSTKIAQLEFETQYDHEGRSMLITASSGFTQLLSVAVSNWDFQNPPDNGIIESTYDATFDYELNEDNPNANCLDLTGLPANVTLCDGGLITYVVNNDIFFSAFEGSTNATITISDCNTSKKTISGSFSAKLQNFDADEITISGTFKNIRYLIP